MLNLLIIMLVIFVGFKLLVGTLGFIFKAGSMGVLIIVVLFIMSNFM